MTFTFWLQYFIVVLVVIASPGPSALLAVSYGSNYDNKRAVGTAIGGGFSATTYIVLALTFISSIPNEFLNIVGVLGSGYIFYLALESFKEKGALIKDKKLKKEVTFNDSILKGFLVGISNPKDILFFAALLPAFILPYYKIFDYFIIYLTWIVLDVGLMSLYGVFGNNISKFLDLKKQRALNFSIGVIFVLISFSMILNVFNS